MADRLRTPFARVFLLASLLAALTIFAYRPAWNGGFIWDDDAYVSKNPLLTAPDGLRRIWFSLDAPSQYFPLVYTTFRIERALWDLNPTGYHWVNLLLHVGNALLLWRLLVRLKLPGAWLAAAIFALHPVQVESVAWITERKNVLMGFFFLLTLLAWVEFIDLQARRRWFFYGAALAFYTLALSAKATACTLPAALLLILWLQKRPINWQRLVQIAPFLLLGLGMGLIAVWWERYHQGTRGALFVLGPAERLLVAGRAIWFYLGKLFWPSNLTFIYPQWRIQARDPLTYLWLFAIGGLSVAIYFGRRFFGRGIEVAALFFVATLSPLLGFIMLYTFRYTFVADHYQYLASIGPIALISAGLARLPGSIKYGRQLLLFLSVLIIGILCLLTWRQSSTYRDIETLWRTTIARNPGSPLAHLNLGVILKEKSKRDEAKAQYLEALKLKPDYAEALTDLGVCQAENSQTEDAIASFRAAIKSDPYYSPALYNLGKTFVAEGKIDEAVVSYKAALQIWSDYAEAHNNLGVLLSQSGKLDEAVSHYTEALRLEPRNAGVHNNLGVVLMQQRQLGEAIQHFREALRLSPQSMQTYINLAQALIRSGRKEEAVQTLREALRVKPDYTEAKEQLRNLEAGDD